MTHTTASCALGRQKCQPRNLAEAIHCVARHSGLDGHRLADLLEVDYATFIRWTEPNGLSQLPARKMAALAQHTGRHDHIVWLAADAGLSVSPIVEQSAADRVKELLDTIDALGQLAATDRDVSVDGIEPEERALLLERVRRAKRELGDYERVVISIKSA